MEKNNFDALRLSQGNCKRNPSQNFGNQKSDGLLDTIQKDIAFFLYPPKSSLKDFSFDATQKRSTILLAVSGGVDSQVMLHSVYSMKEIFSFDLHVVTVNHNIRSYEESKSDADLVFEYCTKELNLGCKIITIEPGEIYQNEKVRNRGVEEAARFVRYTSIMKYANELGTRFVFFAHNRDDQLETLLQHFLQGSCAGISGYSSSGIRQMGTYPFSNKEENSAKQLMVFRPLLNVSRCDIESYARLHSIPYNTDSTNDELLYYRNKIRHKLIPLLNEHFIGWDTGILNGGKKAFYEAHFIDELSKKLRWQLNKDARIDASVFYSQGYPVRIRALYKALEKIGVRDRIPFAIVHACAEGQRRVEGFGLEMFQQKGTLVIRKLDKISADEANFSLKITECGVYSTKHGLFEVKDTVEKTTVFADTDSGDYYMGEFMLPLTIRSKKAGDKIRTAQGTHKTVKKIFSEWGVDRNHRPLLPIIEQKGELKCLCGSPYGYKNWHVKYDTSELDKTVFVRFIRIN